MRGSFSELRCKRWGERRKEEKSVRNQLELLNLVDAGALPRTVRTIRVNRREVLLRALRVRLQGLGALLPVCRADLAVLLLQRHSALKHYVIKPNDLRRTGKP